MKHPHQNGGCSSGEANNNDVSPMLEHYLKKHASLVTEDKERKLNYEDCCKYCDIYANNRLPSGKHKQIEAWTENVNANMAQSQRVSSAKINGSSTNNKDNQPKLKFLKYTPIGKPDADHGFRRIRSDIRRSKSLREESYNKPNGTDLSKKRKTKVLNHRAMDTDTFYDLEKNKQAGSKDGDIRSKSDIISKNNADKPHSARSTITISNTSIISQPTSHASSSQTQRSTQLGSRTTSNNLLNCISIDDSFRQHRGTLATTSPWLGLKHVEEEQMLLYHGNIALRSQPSREQLTNCSDDKIKTNPINSSDPPPFVSQIGRTDSHKAVFTGFDNLEATNEATNSSAYKGLYKFDKSCGQPLHEKKVSRKFQRLNKNLHKMVEEFHIHGSSISNKMRKWKDGDLVVESVDVSSLGASSYSRPQSGYSSTSSHNNTPARGVRFRTSASKRPGHGGTYAKHQRTVPEQDTSINNTGDDGRESFLEMIMDMDEKKSGGQGNVQIHSYLYV